MVVSRSKGGGGIIGGFNTSYLLPNRPCSQTPILPFQRYNLLFIYLRQDFCNVHFNSAFSCQFGSGLSKRNPSDIENSAHLHFRQYFCHPVLGSLSTICIWGPCSTLYGYALSLTYLYRSNRMPPMHPFANCPNRGDLKNLFSGVYCLWQQTYQPIQTFSAFINFCPVSWGLRI